MPKRVYRLDFDLNELMEETKRCRAWAAAREKVEEAQRQLEEARRELGSAERSIKQLIDRGYYCICEIRDKSQPVSLVFTPGRSHLSVSIRGHDPDCEDWRPETTAAQWRMGNSADCRTSAQLSREEHDRRMAAWQRQQILVDSHGMHYRRGLAEVEGANQLRPVINPRTGKQEQDLFVTGDPMGPHSWAGMPSRPKFPFPEAPGPYQGTDGQVLHDPNPFSRF